MEKADAWPFYCFLAFRKLPDFEKLPLSIMLITFSPILKLSLLYFI